METDSTRLTGKTIVVTRPTAQAQALMHTLQSHGATALHCPTIDIQPIDWSLNTPIEDFDCIIVMSANAIPSRCPIPVIAIGPGTQKALHAAGIKVSELPEQFNSEGLLALDILQNVQNKKMLIFCGENPRPLLHNTLTKRGASVTQVFCYRRVKPTLTQDTINPIKKASIDIIISTSSEGLNNLFALFDEHNITLKTTTQLLVISETMQKSARSHWPNHPVIVAENATDTAIMHTLMETL